jgi:hypothetical protein
VHRSGSGGAGIDLSGTGDPLAIQLGGTVTNPAIKADLGSLTSSVAQQAVKQAVTEKVEREASGVPAGRLVGDEGGR